MIFRSSNKNSTPNLIQGFTLANSAGATATRIDCAIGTAMVSTNSAQIIFSSTFSGVTGFKLNGNFPLATGNLDAGVVAVSQTYHVFAIASTSPVQVTNGLFSLSATAPALPAGYTIFRRIGSITTDGSANIRQFVQDGDSFTLNGGLLVLDTLNGGVNADVSLAGLPAGITVECHGVLCTTADSSNVTQGWGNIYPPGTINSAPTL